jgi:hypothetical protein
MTPQQRLMEAEDQLDFALRNRDAEEVTRISALLPALREAVQVERSRERIKDLLGPIRDAFKTNKP